MNKNLPKTQQAFTLIELLVVVTIVALISIVAIALFSNAQRDARDGKRKAELESISNVLEVNKITGGGAYQQLTYTYFGGKVYPGGTSPNTTAALDPEGYPYCIASNATAVPGRITSDSGWTKSPAACPTGYTPSYNIIDNTQPPSGTFYYTICTRLENRNVPNNPFCRSNVQ